MKKYVVLAVLAAAFFAVPAMADCADDNMVVSDGLVGVSTGGLTFEKYPSNMNFDFVNQGSQRAFAAGFSPFNRPQANNAFNLQKDQEAGAVNQMAKKDCCDRLYDEKGQPWPQCCDECQCKVDSRVVNLEMITSGNQWAVGFGNGMANNQVNIMTKQCGNYPKCCCCDSQPCDCDC